MIQPRPAEPASGQVIILTGPPGAGKSTVARLLADRFSKSVHLHSDDFWTFIRQGRISPYRPGADQQNRVVVGVLSQAAFGYAAGDYVVVYDGIVGPWFLEVFLQDGDRTGIPVHYVVLRPDEPTTVSRATTRGAHALTAEEPVRELYRQFSGLGALESHVLDTTVLNPQDTVDAVMNGLAENRYQLDLNAFHEQGTR